MLPQNLRESNKSEEVKGKRRTERMGMKGHQKASMEDQEDVE